MESFPKHLHPAFQEVDEVWVASEFVRWSGWDREVQWLFPFVHALVGGHEPEVVLGKYLGALAFYASLWVPTLLYLYMIRSPVDAGPVAASYLGTLLVGAVFCAVGVFTSALTRNQIVAAILSFLITGGFLFVLGIAEMVTQDPDLRSIFGYFSVFTHMADFGKGVIDSRRLVFYGSTIALLLFATVRTLEAKRGQT